MLHRCGSCRCLCTTELATSRRTTVRKRKQTKRNQNNDTYNIQFTYKCIQNIHSSRVSFVFDECNLEEVSNGSITIKFDNGTTNNFDPSIAALSRHLLASLTSSLPTDLITSSVLQQKALKEINYGPPSDLDISCPSSKRRFTKPKKREGNVGQVYLYFKSVNSTRSFVQTRRCIYIYDRKGEINWTNYPSAGFIYLVMIYFGWKNVLWRQFRR